MGSRERNFFLSSKEQFWTVQSGLVPFGKKSKTMYSFSSQKKRKKSARENSILLYKLEENASICTLRGSLSQAREWGQLACSISFICKHSDYEFIFRSRVAELCVETFEFENALKHAFRSLELREDFYRTYKIIADAYYFRHEWKKAIEFYEKAIEKSQEDNLKKEFAVWIRNAEICDSMSYSARTSWPLPMVVTAHIFSFLSIRDLVSVSYLSREWNKISCAPIIWRKIADAFADTCRIDLTGVNAKYGWKQVCRSIFLNERLCNNCKQFSDKVSQESVCCFHDGFLKGYPLVWSCCSNPEGHVGCKTKLHSWGIRDRSSFALLNL